MTTLAYTGWTNSHLAERCNRDVCIIVLWRPAVIRNKRYRFGDSLIGKVKIVAHHQAIGGVVRREKSQLVRKHRFKEPACVITGDHLGRSVRHHDVADAHSPEAMLAGIHLVRDFVPEGFGRQIPIQKCYKGRMLHA